MNHIVYEFNYQRKGNNMNPTLFRTRKFGSKSVQSSFHEKAFNEFWPAYKSWYQSKKSDVSNPKLLKEAETQLAKVMPELIPVYESFREVSNDCPIAANFLTGHQPPGYLINCSQAVLTNEQPLLIRNYDLSPVLSENLITHSNFLGQPIIGTNECLWGLDDGMNSSGLAASFTFGGSKKVGKGFGIPFIMRYVLETCENVKQAVKVLQRVSSHMAYNITLLDKKGHYATVMVAPERDAIVTHERCITNHQQHVTWPEQARFSKTIERKQYLDELLKDKTLNKSQIIDSFLNSPLRSNNYEQQFGTVFTAIYQPEQGTMAYHWPDEEPLKVSFDHFVEQNKTVNLEAKISTFETTYATSNFTSDYTSQSQNYSSDYSINYDSIPLEIRECLLMGLEYLPSSSDKQDSSISKLKQILKSDKSISWAEYGNSLAASI